jgi:biotin operon repressor
MLIAREQEFSFGLPPFVPIPLVYVDELMPTLTDAQLRVLLIVIRQTLGWVDRDSITGRKERDWITQSQLRQKTGKSRDSISLAIASLVERGLLKVEDRHGKPLDSPRSRQNNRDRLYFRLGDDPDLYVAAQQ